MTYDESVTDRERKIARWLAVAMHAGFVLLLVFGVAWQKRHSEPAAIVDLWSSLAPPKPEPPAPAPRPQPKVERKAEPVPPPPKPEVKPVPKPDIALREKLEKERKANEQQELEKKKQADLKKKEDEAKKLKAESKKKDDTAEKDRVAKEVELKRLAQEKGEIDAKLAKQKSATQQALNEKYITLIQNHVKQRIVDPPNLQGSPEVEFDVVLIPGGEVLSVKLRRTSGVPAYDAAVERAILKASPLPLPQDAALFQQFRDLHLKIKPR